MHSGAVIAVLEHGFMGISIGVAGLQLSGDLGEEQAEDMPKEAPGAGCTVRVG